MCSHLAANQPHPSRSSVQADKPQCTMSLKGQALLLTLILGLVVPSTRATWIDPKDLIRPLEGCQFVMTTSEQWGESFPPIGHAILSAIREMDNHVQLLSTLKHYKRTRYDIRHQHPRIVHISLHPPPAVAKSIMCGLPLIIDNEMTAVHKVRDIVFLFVDRQIRRTYELLWNCPCVLCNTYIIVPFSDVRVWSNPIVQLARQGRGRENVVTRSSEELQLRVVGASFVELVEDVTRLRMDFHDDIVMLATNYAWRDGFLYRIDKFDVPLLKFSLFLHLHESLEIVHFLLLTDWLNFTARLTYQFETTTVEVCRYGSLSHEVTLFTAVGGQEDEAISGLFYKGMYTLKVFYFSELNKPSAVKFHTLKRPFSGTVWIVWTGTVGALSVTCIVLLSKTMSLNEAIRFTLGVGSTFILQVPAVPKRVVPLIGFWGLLSN